MQSQFVKKKLLPPKTFAGRGVGHPVDGRVEWRRQRGTPDDGFHDEYADSWRVAAQPTHAEPALDG